MSTLDFSLQASMWGSNVPANFNYDFRDLYFYTAGTPTTGFGGEVGGWLYARASATLGLDYRLGFGLLGNLDLKSGAVNVDYDLVLNENVSTPSINDNIAYIDTADFQLGTAEISSSGLDLASSSLDLDLGAELYARIFGDASIRAGARGTHPSLEVSWHQECVFGICIDVPDFTYRDVPYDVSVGTSGGFDATLVDFKDSIPLLNLDGSDVDPLVLDYGYGRLTAKLPDPINASSKQAISDEDGLANLSVSGESSPFVTASFNLAAAIGAAFGLPPEVFSGSQSVDIGFAKLGLDYTTLAANLVGNAALTQDFEFDAQEVSVEMTTSTGQKLSGKLGDKFEFETPEGEGEITVDTTYTLTGALTATTGLQLTGAFQYKLLEAIAKVSVDASVDLPFGLGRQGIRDSWSTSVGPLLSGDIPIGGGLETTLITDTSEYSLGSIAKTYKIKYENFYKGTQLDDTFTLTSHQVSVDAQGGNDTVTGNLLDNEILGNAGDDKLAGKAGDDKIMGGEGSDTAIFIGEWADYEASQNSFGQIIVKDQRSGSDGQDTLLDVEFFQFTDGTLSLSQLLGPRTDYNSSHDYTLPDDGLNLTATGSENSRLVGNALNNSIMGNAGQNTIYGGAGRDKVNGGIGNDILYGGAGKDAFLFTSKLGTWKTDRKVNFDAIKDFSVKNDSIFLDNAIFKKIGSGSIAEPKQLLSKYFSLDKAKDKNDYIVYNTKTGILSYDADGSNKGQAAEFAQLKKGLALTYKDFFVI